MESQAEIDRLVHHRAWLARLARSLVGESAGDDLVQETWMAVLRMRPDPELPLRPWLARVVRRLAGKHRERERRLAELHDRGRSTDELPSTDELIERIDLEKQLAEAVQQLPEPQRTVVLLRYYGELSSAEIARRRGVPAGTVRRQLKEGLDRLRERMDRSSGGRAAWCTVLLGWKSPASAAPLMTGGVGMSIATKGLVAAGIVAAVVGIPVFLQGGGRAPKVTAARLDAPEPIQVEPNRVAPARAVEEQAEQRAVVVPEAEQATVPDEAGSNPEWERMEARLRTALERSIYGSLDPGAILDAALELAEHDADPRAVPEPDPTGALRFEVLDAPESVSAELRVARSNNPDHASVLGLKLKLEPSVDPYVVDGLARQGAEVDLTTWTDPEGRLLHFTIYTNLQPAWRTSRELGTVVDLDTAEITKGMAYHLDFQEPSNWKTSALGYSGGTTKDWEIQAAFQGGPWPRLVDIELFRDRLTAMYAKVKER